MAINALGIATTTSGFSLYPFVSSSKNLSRPALDAGSGADFLLLMLLWVPDFYIKTFVLDLFDFRFNIHDIINGF